jgi:DNA-binding HxlR family transcriptional regulator
LTYFVVFDILVLIAWKMDKEYFIQLTKNLYHLTLLFPKKEPLRYKMRELTDEILANLLSILEGNFHKSGNFIAEIEKDLEVLDSYFEVAIDQNWVRPEDVLEIQSEYSNIKEEIEKVKIEEKNNPPLQSARENINDNPVESDNDFINERQQKILDILREKGKTQVGQLVSVFPQISKRTLRRDFRSLLKRGLIERIGEKNYTFYQTKSTESRTS